MKSIKDEERTMKSVKLAVCLLTLSLLVAGCATTEQAFEPTTSSVYAQEFVYDEKGYPNLETVDLLFDFIVLSFC